MEQRDPIERFEEFFRKVYYKELLDIARQYPDKRSIVVDYSDIDKFDLDLADALISRPEETLKEAKDAISEIELPVEDLEVKINVRIKNLPESQYFNVRDLRAEHINQFVSIEGIVKSATEVRPEAVTITFECPYCKHKMTVPQFARRHTSPSMCENASCGRRARFTIIKEDLVDTQRISIQEPPETIIGSEQPSQLYIQLKEELVTPLERKKILPGNRVKLIGILRKVPFRTKAGAPTTRYDLYLDAIHVDPIEREFEEIELDKKDIAKIKKLAKNAKVYEKFISSIAPSIYGYDAIKEAILLQLFGGVQKIQPDGTKVRGNIHLFLIGDPAVGKSQLLRYVSDLSPKGRFVSGKKASGVGLTAAVVRDDFAGGWILEAGALILANNGIVSVDEFDKMDADDRSAMLESMEQGNISIAKAGIVTTLRANTSVLAAANPKYGRFDTYKSLAEQINLSPVILSRFDLKFPIQDVPGKEKDVELADHVLDSFISPKEITPEVDILFMRKYIAYAKNNISPMLTKEARDIIKNFYVSWRSRSSEDGEEELTVSLTARQLEALVRLSEASARIRLSKKVTAADARRAIRLLELSLKKLAMEPETGKIDIDRIDASTSSAQRGKIRTVISIVEEFLHEGVKSVPIEDILIETTKQGIEQVDALELIENLKKKGDLFEPKPGYVQKA